MTNSFDCLGLNLERILFLACRRKYFQKIFVESSLNRPTYRRRGWKENREIQIGLKYGLYTVHYEVSTYLA
jgi:hypothetical protein